MFARGRCRARSVDRWPAAIAEKCRCSPSWVGFVVVRRDLKEAVYAELLAGLAELERLGRGVAAGAGDDRNAPASPPGRRIRSRRGAREPKESPIRRWYPPPPGRRCPPAIWSSTSWPRASKSTPPSRMGVTNAVIAPSSFMIAPVPVFCGLLLYRRESARPGRRPGRSAFHRAACERTRPARPDRRCRPKNRAGEPRAPFRSSS